MSEMSKVTAKSNTSQNVTPASDYNVNSVNTYSYEPTIEKYKRENVIESLKNKKIPPQQIINYMNYFSAKELLRMYRNADVEPPVDILLIVLSQNVSDVNDDEVITLQKAYGEEFISNIYQEQGQKPPKSLSGFQSFKGFFGRLFNVYTKVEKGEQSFTTFSRSRGMKNETQRITELYEKNKSPDNIKSLNEQANKGMINEKMNVTFIEKSDLEDYSLNDAQDILVEKIKEKVEEKSKKKDEENDKADKKDEEKKEDTKEETKKIDEQEKKADELVKEAKETDKTKTADEKKEEKKIDEKDKAQKADVYSKYGKSIILKNPKINNYYGLNKGITVVSSDDILLNINHVGIYDFKNAKFQVIYDAKNDTRIAKMHGGSINIELGNLKFEMTDIRFSSADETFYPEQTKLSYSIEIDDKNKLDVSGSIAGLSISRGDISLRSFALGVDSFSFLDGMFTGNDVKFFMGKQNNEVSNLKDYAKGLALGGVAFEYKDNDKSIVKIAFSSGESGKSDTTGVAKILSDNGIKASYLFCKGKSGKYGLQLDKARFDLSVYDDLVKGSLEDVDLGDTKDGKTFSVNKATLAANIDTESTKLTPSVEFDKLQVTKAGTKFEQMSAKLGTFSLFNEAVEGRDAVFVLNGVDKNYAKRICLGAMEVKTGDDFSIKLDSNNPESGKDKGYWALVQNIKVKGKEKTSAWEPDIKDATATINMFNAVKLSAEKINYSDKKLKVGKSTVEVKINEPSLTGNGEAKNISYDFAKKDFQFEDINASINDFNIFGNMIEAKNSQLDIKKQKETYDKNVNVKDLALKTGSDFNANITSKADAKGWNVGQNNDKKWYTFVEGGSINIGTNVFDLNASNININNKEKKPGLNSLKIDDITGKLKVFEEETGGIDLTVTGLELKDKTLDFKSITGGTEKIKISDSVSLIKPKIEIGKKPVGKVAGKPADGKKTSYYVNVSSGFKADLGSNGSIESENVILSFQDKKFDSFKVEKPSLKLKAISTEIKADSIDILNTEKEKGVRGSNLSLVLSKTPDDADSDDKESTPLLDYLGLDGLTATVDEISYINKKFKIGKPKFSVDEITIGKDNKIANLKIGLGDKKYIKGALNFEFPGSDHKPEKSGDLGLEELNTNNGTTNGQSKEAFPANINPKDFGVKSYDPPEVFGMKFMYPLIPGVMDVHAGFGFGAGLNVYGLLDAALGKAEKDSKENDKLDFSGTLGFAGGLWAAAKLGAGLGATGLLTLNADFLAKLGINVNAGAKADVSVLRKKEKDKYKTSVKSAEINFGITSDLVLELLGKITANILFFKEKTLYEKKFKKWQLGAMGFQGKAIYEAGNKLKMQDMKKGMTINGKEVGSIKDAKDLNKIELEDLNKQTLDIENDREKAENLLLDLEKYAYVAGIGMERKKLAGLVNEVIVVYDQALKEAYSLADKVEDTLKSANEKKQEAIDDKTANERILKHKMRLEYLYYQKNMIDSSVAERDGSDKGKGNGKDKDKDESATNSFNEDAISDLAIDSYQKAGYVTNEYLKASFAASFYGYCMYKAKNSGEPLKNGKKSRCASYSAGVRNQIINYPAEVFLYDITTESPSTGYEHYNLFSSMAKYYNDDYTLVGNFYDIMDDTSTYNELMKFANLYIFDLVEAGGKGLKFGDNEFNDHYNGLVSDYLKVDDYSLRYRMLKGELGKTSKWNRSTNFLKTANGKGSDFKGLKGHEKLSKLVEFEEQRLFVSESSRREATEYADSIKKQKTKITGEISRISNILTPLKKATTMQDKELDDGAKKKEIISAIKKGCLEIRANKLTEKKVKNMKRDPALFLFGRTKKE